MYRVLVCELSTNQHMDNCSTIRVGLQVCWGMHCISLISLHGVKNNLNLGITYVTKKVMGSTGTNKTGLH